MGIVVSHISSFLYLAPVATKSEAPTEHCKKKSRLPTNASQTTCAAPRRVHLYVGKKALVGNKIKRFERGGFTPPLNYAERLNAGFAPARQRNKCVN